MKRLVLLSVVAFALAAAAGATGYSFGKSVNVRKGDSAVFLPSHWQCNNQEGGSSASRGTPTHGRSSRVRTVAV